MQLDSEQVLRSIEHHHGLVVARAKGIYSFSHLTFHEYFTAREFVVVRQSSEEALQNLVSHITEKRWQEVFLLAVGMSPSADRLLLLIKEKIDAILSKHENLLYFITWVNQKSISVKVPFTTLTVREFYIDFDYEFNFDFSLNNYLTKSESELDFESESNRDNFDYAIRDGLKNSFDSAINGLKKSRFLLLNRLNFFSTEDEEPLRHLSLHADEFEVDNALISALNHSRKLAFAASTVSKFKIGSQLSYALNRAITSTSDYELQRSLRRFKQQIPDPDKDRGIFKTLWRANGKSWVEKLKLLLISYRNIGHEWHFTDEQKEIFKQYYDAHKILISCLNSDCYVSREVRQQIEDTLLLPIAEIKQRQQQS